jgi:hypothetical protein
MKRLSASVLIACACAGLLLACSPEAYSEGGTGDIKPLGQYSGNVTMAVDNPNLNHIVAGDWVSRLKNS